MLILLCSMQAYVFFNFKMVCSISIPSVTKKSNVTNLRSKVRLLTNLSSSVMKESQIWYDAFQKKTVQTGCKSRITASIQEANIAILRSVWRGTKCRTLRYLMWTSRRLFDAYENHDNFEKITRVLGIKLNTWYATIRRYNIDGLTHVYKSCGWVLNKLGVKLR